MSVQCSRRQQRVVTVAVALGIISGPQWAIYAGQPVLGALVVLTAVLLAATMLAIHHYIGIEPPR